MPSLQTPRSLADLTTIVVSNLVKQWLVQSCCRHDPMSRFIPFSRNQEYLLPPSVNDWLPEDYLARFIVEIVEQLVLSKSIRSYSACGSTAYHTALMLALLVYWYAAGRIDSQTNLVQVLCRHRRPWH